MQDGDYLASLLVFAAVHETGSFSEAARRLRITRSAASKQVQRLEASLGVRLLHRTTRALSLTDAGRAAYEHAAQVAQSARAARTSVDALTSTPRGLLRITTSVAFGNCVLAPLLPEYLQRFPDVEVDLVLADSMTDLAESGIDIAVRISDSVPDLSIARRLAPVRYFAVTAPDSAYAREVRRPQDLERCNVLRYTRPASPRAKWSFFREDAQYELRMPGRASVNSSQALAVLAARGLGVALVPDYVARDYFARHELSRLLPEWELRGPLGAAVWILRLPGRSVLPTVRSFTDFLSASFGADAACEDRAVSTDSRIPEVHPRDHERR